MMSLCSEKRGTPRKIWTKQQSTQIAFQGGDRRELDAEAGNMSVSFNTMSTTTERPYRMQSGAASLLAS
jgi:hypothetical protein